MHNFQIIRRFCENLSIAPRERSVTAVWPNRKCETFRLHCYAERVDAEAFVTEFSGVHFDPKTDRGKGKRRNAWVRNEEWQRVLESGPLKTLTRANLQIIAQQYDRTVARQARLQAERLGLPAIDFPESLLQRAAEADVEALIAGENSLFESRNNSRRGLKSQLEARAEQLAKQIEGLVSQRKATDESAALVERDFTSLSTLYKKKLVSLERISELELELSRLRGESGRLAAAIAETEGKISETRMQALQVDEEMRKEVNEELRELDGKEVELIERKTVAQDQLSRTEIRAPQSGLVQELAVHTVGGVISPGETLMMIVPGEDRLVVDAMIAPASIDDVEPGQPVSIRFSAFDANTTPECKGTVQRVSADLIKDPQRQISYFVARTMLDHQKSCLGASRRLQPGMPAEVHIQTGERNVWSYVMKPLSDQVQRAFRE
jgi:HlyD family secretion protein